MYKNNVISLWALQNTSRDILCKKHYDFLKEKPPAIFSCCRSPITDPKKKSVEVHLKNDTRKSFYKNLSSCNSVWICPVCASKITSERTERLNISLDNWYQKSDCHRTAFITYTMPHYHGQTLADIRKIFMSARRRMHRQKKLNRNLSFIPYSEICENYGIVGSVTGIELTYGLNGWHLHCHEILFLAWSLRDDQVDVLRNLLVKAWKHSLMKENCQINNPAVFDMRSVVIEKFDKQNKNIVSQYISKFSGWTVSHELTKSAVKKGRVDNLSIWDFLRNIFLQTEGHEKYFFLYREYAEVMKGTRQLFFSKNMSNLLCYKDVEVVIDPELSEFLGELNDLVWYKIVKTNNRFNFLQIVDNQGFEVAINYIKYLKLNENNYGDDYEKFKKNEIRKSELSAINC